MVDKRFHAPPGQSVAKWVEQAELWPSLHRAFRLAMRMHYELGISWDVAIQAAALQEGESKEFVDLYLRGLALACIRDGLVKIEVSDE